MPRILGAILASSFMLLAAVPADARRGDCTRPGQGCGGVIGGAPVKQKAVKPGVKCMPAGSMSRQEREATGMPRC